MRPPSPRRLMAAVSAAQQAIAAAGDRIDPQLRADTIEGESEALELMDRYADLVLADEHLASLARYKAIQLEKRAAAHRGVVERMLIALELSEPVQRTTYTASLTYRDTAIVTDRTLLPSEVLRPDMRLIAKVLRDGQPVPGAELSNPQPHLMIKTAREAAEDQEHE